MKTEYTVEIWNHIKNDEFCLIATLKNKQTFFIGIFNIFTLPEFSHIEDLKRRKEPVSCIFTYRNRYAESVRYSHTYHKSEIYIFSK